MVYQIWSETLMIKIVLLTNHFYLIHNKFQEFTKLLQMVAQRISKTEMPKMIQSGGVSIPNAFDASNPLFFFSLFRMIRPLAKSYGKELENKDPKKIDSNILAETGFKMIVKKIKKIVSSITDSGRTLTNNEIKDIMKVSICSWSRGILIKATSRKITGQEGAFLNFLTPLITAILPLMKNVLTPLVKSVLTPFGLTAVESATDAATQKKMFGLGNRALTISKKEVKHIMKILKSLEKSVFL